MRSLSLLALLAPLVAFGLATAPTPAFAVKRAGAAAPSPGVVQVCDWDRPGHNPYMGDVVAAVDRYQDIPADVRTRLKARMVKRDYDDVVTIRRDSIEGKARYGATIRDMHFGTRQICRSVTRSAWSNQMKERGLVYCEGGDCILVPTVCRNVSRIARAQVANERAEGELPPVAVVPPLPGEDGPALLKGDLPSGLPGVDAEPVPGVPFAGESASFEAGTVAGTSFGPIAPTDGRGAAPSWVESSTVFDTAAAGPGLELPGAVAPIPEPETWCLLASGLIALGTVSRRRRSRSS